MIPCIIPARGGSKSVPRKNLIPIGGKPLIAWSIEQALGCSSIDQVTVATDDDEIEKAAKSTGYLGVCIFRRSKASASDDAPTEAVLIEAVAELWSEVEAVVMLQATSPVRQPDDIEKAIELFRQTRADSLFSARAVEGYTWSAGGRVLQPRDGIRKPRQLETRHTLEENGSIYIFKPKILLEQASRLGGKIVPYIMHPLDSFQLDEPEDVELIDTLLKLRCGGKDEFPPMPEGLTTEEIETMESKL